MGILFDAVMNKKISPAMIHTGAVIGAAMCVGTEPKTDLNQPVWYRHGVYMREEPAGSRKERGHEGNGSAQ